MYGASQCTGRRTTLVAWMRFPHCLRPNALLPDAPGADQTARGAEFPVQTILLLILKPGFYNNRRTSKPTAFRACLAAQPGDSVPQPQRTAARVVLI